MKATVITFLVFVVPKAQLLAWSFSLPPPSLQQCRHQTHTASSRSHDLSMAAASSSSSSSSDKNKSKNDPLANMPGIVERGKPTPIKSKRIQAMMERENSRPRRGERFYSPPPRPSGMYEGLKFQLPDGHVLGYDEYYLADQTTDLVLCLNNLASGKRNKNSFAIRDYCQKTFKNFLCFDWFGRGESSGKLLEATLSRWTSDTIVFLEGTAKHVAGGGRDGEKAVLVGTGVGAWVAVLVALRRPDLVRGIVGLSADPDFTEDLLWEQLPEEEKEAIMREGFREVKWGGRQEVYPITSSLIEDGRKNLVLRGGKDSLDIQCPVRLIHSLNDEEVPVTVPLRLAECVETKNVRIIMTKKGGHLLHNDIMPRRPAWIDPESPDRDVAPMNIIQSVLEQCMNQVFGSTLPEDHITYGG